MTALLGGKVLAPSAARRDSSGYGDAVGSSTISRQHQNLILKILHDVGDRATWNDSDRSWHFVFIYIVFFFAFTGPKRL